jgi:hypothetical protein
MGVHEGFFEGKLSVSMPTEPMYASTFTALGSK